MTKQQLQARLAPFDQQHVLAFWEELTPSEQQSLAAQVSAIDLPLIQKKLNMHYPLTLDLFGAEISTNSANYYNALYNTVLAVLRLRRAVGDL